MPEYPLQQVLAVKHDRVKKAEKVVTEKERALEVEEEKLKKVEEERDAVKRHYDDKLAQLRKALDEGTTSVEVQQMKDYLDVVTERLKGEDEKVAEQKKQVKEAEDALAAAKEDLKQKRVEEEKIEMHKVEWEKEARIEMAREEAKEHDEIGSTGYISRKRKENQ